MKKVFRIITAILLIFVTASCARAQQSNDSYLIAQANPYKIKEKFISLDKNHDGMVSQEEFSGPKAKFDRLDLDGNGLITMDELKGAYQRQRQGVEPRIQESQIKQETNSSGDMASPSSVLFGMNLTPRELKRDIKYAQELGISAVRFPMPWQAVEPRKGKINWEQVDYLVDLAQSYSIEVVFMIRSISPWGTKSQTKRSGGYHSASMPRDLKVWEGFLEKLAGHYKGRGVHYEIENEVSGKAFWSGTKAEYVELLKVSYAAIKRTDPYAKVLHAAMPCGITRNFSNANHQLFKKHHDDWLRIILSTKAFDIVNVHNYYFPSEIIANGFTFRSYQRHIKDLMNKAGVGDRPIWITEAGYVSRRTQAAKRSDSGTPERQAKWIKEAYYQAPEFGVERIFWILLRDRDEKYFGSMGFADAQGNPRPAWRKLQQLNKTR